jgi:hypothetical protein
VTEQIEQPTGLAMWGQAGVYNAPDDRLVITALADGRRGLVSPVSIAAGPGLTALIAGGWLGAADCGDGTVAVVGSRHQETVTLTPGDASGAPRTDYVWCDIDPDEGTWEIVVMPAGAAAGRSGIRLATVSVPANSNLATQMTFTPAKVTFGNLPGLTLDTPGLGTCHVHATAGGLLWVRSENYETAGAAVLCLNDGWHRAATAANGLLITPKWIIPAGDLQPHTHWQVKTSGTGRTGTVAQQQWFDVSVGPENFYVRVTVDSIGLLPANTNFIFEVVADLQLNFAAGAVVVSIKATVDRPSATTVARTAMECVYDIPVDRNRLHVTYIRAGAAGIAGGAASGRQGQFLRFGGFDPGSQIEP